MVVLSKLLNKDISIKTTGENANSLNRIEKFFEYFFIEFFIAIFERNYDRYRFPIIKSNHIHVYEPLQGEIHVVFIKSETFINEINYEYHEDYRSSKSLIDIMLMCEKKYGEVLWGVSLDYHTMYRRETVQDIVLKYIARYE